jgi:Spy/CpxP family protein refolding chaperone
MEEDMTRKLSLSAAAAIAVAVGVGLAADAWAKGPGRFGHGAGARLERAVEKLELDEAKRAEVFAVIDAARPAGRALREKMRAAHEEMRALLEDASAGEEAVLAKADAVGALRTELAKHELRTLIQVRTRLSAEQQAQLAEAMSRKHCGRHERRHVL